MTTQNRRDASSVAALPPACEQAVQTALHRLGGQRGKLDHAGYDRDDHLSLLRVRVLEVYQHYQSVHGREPDSLYVFRAIWNQRCNVIRDCVRLAHFVPLENNDEPVRDPQKQLEARVVLERVREEIGDEDFGLLVRAADGYSGPLAERRQFRAAVCRARARARLAFPEIARQNRQWVERCRSKNEATSNC